MKLLLLLVVLLPVLLGVACGGEVKPTPIPRASNIQVPLVLPSAPGLSTAEGYFDSAGRLHQEGKLQEAIAGYNEAIRLDPTLAKAYSNRGSVYTDLGQPETAILDYNQAISLDPKLAVAYSNRGKAYYDLGDLDNAIPDYDEALRLDPRLVVAYLNRGAVYRVLDQP